MCETAARAPSPRRAGAPLFRQSRDNTLPIKVILGKDQARRRWPNLTIAPENRSPSHYRCYTISRDATLPASHQAS